MTRQMSVAGTFYPARDIELLRYFEHFTKVYDEEFQLPNINTRAVIVPHAGYIYSGYTANIAYRLLQRGTIKNFLVIGPSHRVAFDGVSVSDFEDFETPFSKLDSHKTMAQKIRETFHLPFIEQAHHEHSTEVQFPFIKHYIPDATIVELVYSNIQAESIAKIIDFALEEKDFGVIISTDLSHFYTQENANKLDAICINAVETQNTNLLHSGCEACGKTGVEAILLSAKKHNLDSHILDYRTSADATGDTSRVVGYLSGCFSS